MWDVEQGERRLDVSARATLSRVIAASAEASIAVTGDDDGILRVFRLPDGRLVRTIDRRGANQARIGTNAIALVDGGRSALVASGVGFGRWDLESGACLRTYEGHAGGVTGLAVLPGEAHVLSSSTDRSVRLWDRETGACRLTLVAPNLPGFVPRYEAEDDQSATGVCVLAGGRRAVSAHGDGRLRVWDLEDGALLDTVRTAADPHWLMSVAASPGGTRVAAGSFDRSVWLWEPGRAPVAMAGHACEVSPAFFLDETHVLSASFDTTLRVWDADRLECVRVIGRAPRHPHGRWPPNHSRW
jgi:WD40 repeat protein